MSTNMEWLRLKKLGQGTYGTVYLAMSTFTEELYFAVKNANLEDSSTLQKERRIFQKFRGANEVVKCYGCCVSNEGGAMKYNLLLEYAPMGSLLNLMRDCGGRIPESHVRKYTKMLLRGLSCIDNNGHVHCDLKPANILVFPREADGFSDVQLKIADFGLAKEPGEDDSDMLFRMYQYRGTPCYMSPESVQFAEITPALDIWSLGCIVVEMITGRIAWGNLDSKELFNKLVSGNESPEIPEYISESGKDFLRRCFELDHRYRWTADALLTHPFVDDAPLQPVENCQPPALMCVANSALCGNY
ncbi:CCR4-NOT TRANSCRIPTIONAL COMPLEX SUBUNIT CAF120-RELATED [Salix purpurea]|uniref:CCR4-NOT TRANSCRIPTIONAL COMPLEX SUBUNIT CAF120-RELATED n=1 Tax=Salix purpurea TaxID=77065 RepID=A0A9Q0PRQ5_SALPP|nr:CCR4-NOT TRANSCRIPTIONAL COMPLEX SUBUNIT CAF120-RELATED [Salix purpurea]